MEVNQLVAHYKANYERKVFMTRLSHAMQNAYLMYIYDYPSELKNFADTFLAYLPFYIRNSDYFETVDENEDIDTQLIARSKNMRKNSKIIPHRQIASDGIYGELFLDFYLRIVNGRKAVITYANKRSFDSNYESTGPDNMIEDEYLSEAEREEKSKTLEEMLALGLTADDMRLSLNVSTKWKVALYKYFRLHPEQVTTSYEKAKDILEAQPKARIESLNYIFHILKAAFEAANIDGFECEPYEIRAFDSQNNFIWGRLYRVYCSGKIANVISSNRKYITGRYEDFIKEHNLTRIKEKRVMQQYFNEEKLGWILRYYKSDLTPNIDAFYSETFKFISSIIQYKIPFYTSFFVSILKLFLQKNALDASLDLSCLDAKKITLLFEDGSVYDDYSKLIDYGVSNDLVMKLHDGHITIAELQEERYDKSIFDEYEQLMLSDFLSIL